MKNTLGYLIFVIVFSLVSALLTAGADEPAPVKAFTATIDPDGVQRVAVTGGGYYFDPGYIIVKVNRPVELTVTKESGFVPHDIVMESPEAGLEFAVDLSSTPKTIAFTPTRAGKYPFFCGKGLPFMESHRDKGMEGTLEVRE
jgi:plastocyanin domain-containing protein